MWASSSALLDPKHTFATLSELIGLDVRLRKAVARLGHARPTLVQSQCLPLALQEGRDLLVRARTGSGKTLAFSLPVLQKLLSAQPSTSKKGIGAIILVPTRELCHQIHQVIQQLTYYCDDVIHVAVLSASDTKSIKVNRHQQQELERQDALLRDQPNLLVSTPSALVTHLRRSHEQQSSVIACKNALSQLKSSLQMLVVDEADLVLSFGYRNDLHEIVQALPRIYQGMLLSATLSPELDALKHVVLNTPVTVKLEQRQDNEDLIIDEGGGGASLKQFYIALPKGHTDKNLVLYVFLKLGLLRGKGLFFVNTTDAGYRLKLFFQLFHIRSAVMNAELPFRSRLHILEQFNLGNFDYLIATDESTDIGVSNRANDNEDILGINDNDDDNRNSKSAKNCRSDQGYGVARGLDFRNVSFVVNVDLPASVHSYAHRIGRTARGGSKGVALSLVDSTTEFPLLHEIQDSQPTIVLAKASTDQFHAVVPPCNIANDEDHQRQRQPVPLDFDLREIEGFRYRVEDVSRSVTRNAIREARAAELKEEVLNSERLQHQGQFQADLQLLAHDRLGRGCMVRLQDHLQHVPKYLLPRGMQVASLHGRKKRKKRSSHQISGERRSDNDPLQNFDGGEVDLDGVRGAEDEGDDDLKGFMDDGSGRTFNSNSSTQNKSDAKKAIESKIFNNTSDGTGNSTSGRVAWKEKHKKGKFSNKKRLSERKYKQPLGL